MMQEVTRSPSQHAAENQNVDLLFLPIFYVATDKTLAIPDVLETGKGRPAEIAISVTQGNEDNEG